MRRVPASLAAFVVLACASTAWAVPVRVTVTKIDGFGSQLEDPARGAPDFYAGIAIGGTSVVYPDEADRTLIEPFWFLGTDVPAAAGTVPVTIRVWEGDECTEPFCTTCDAGGGDICGLCDPGCSPDDEADVSPSPTSTAVELMLDLATGTWTGTTTGNCARGDDPAASVLVCWDISLSASGDVDGDGLLDGWESRPIDFTGDGVPDVDLPAWGANPRHKDLFLEFDWLPGQEPTRDAIQTVKQAFADAPIDAGGIPNPDALPGIALHIDTGSLTDPTASEDGGPPGSCGDSLDNGGDAVADAADRDCLVGDDLGGGNQLVGPCPGPALCIPPGPPPPADICFLGDDYYAVKRVNFHAPLRRQIFRYGMSARCSSHPAIGGIGEGAGNDFIDYFHDAGTIMHEFGHTLNLAHGGLGQPDPDFDACKPNYLSVQSYSYVFQQLRLTCPPAAAAIFGCDPAEGLRPRDLPAFRVDYSPPRVCVRDEHGTVCPATRGLAPLPSLVEANLDESSVLDPTDSFNMLVHYVDQKPRTTPVNAPVDWNGSNGIDGPLCPNPPWACEVVDVDKSALCPDDWPPVLNGYDDWRNVALSFREFGDSANVALGAFPEPELSAAQIRQFVDEANTADLALLSKTADREAALAGRPLTYTLHITNHGPNVALRAVVVDLLPPGFTYQASSIPCVEAPPGTLTCEVGVVAVGEIRTFTVTGLVARSLVYDAGGPTTLTNSASVGNRVGPDPDTRNDGIALETRVLPDDLNVTKVRLWGRPDGARPGSAVVYGDFLTAPALGDVVGTSAGIAIRVRDGAGLDETFGWSASECRTAPSGTVKCKSATKSVAKFRPFPKLPTLYKFAVKGRDLPIQAPFQRPVTVTLTYETTIREGQSTECRAGPAAIMVCLSPGRGP